MKRAKVEMIEIKLPSGKVIKLTERDAEALADKLADLFGRPVVYPPPIIIEREPAPRLPHIPWGPWCGDTVLQSGIQGSSDEQTRLVS